MRGIALFCLLLAVLPAADDTKKKAKLPSVLNNEDIAGNIVLGVPTARSVTVNICAVSGMEAFIEYADTRGKFTSRTETAASRSGEPIVICISGLSADTQYFYRVRMRKNGSDITSGEYSFRTQRKAGSAFTFGVQGDSHPEREGKMFSPELYRLTMAQVSNDRPDLYFAVGDDFSIEGFIEKKEVRRETVESAYLLQRPYFGIIGASTPLFLVNGNHEQAARYLLDGTPDCPSVLAANARIKYYALPVPDDFYRGDTEMVEHVGLLRDYYSFEWGDALFAVIDPYWHSPVAVDNTAGGKGGGDKSEKGEKGEKSEKKEKGKGGGKGGRDGWAATMGDAQYRWLSETLLNSKAKYKFVFAHHVLGTGRGGIEMAKLYEWGGHSQNGDYDFKTKRPQWERTVHKLFVDAHVTIFFQGHDHVFAKQELDGVVYQSLPNPADDTYTAFNKEAYKSGDTMPNAGYVRVSVSLSQVKVDYLRSFLAKDESREQKNGMMAYSYTITNIKGAAR